MYKPIRDALDRAADTATPSRPEREAVVGQLPAPLEEARARRMEASRETAAPVIGTRRSRRLPLSWLPSRPRGDLRTLLRASTIIVLLMVSIAGNASSASAADPVDIGDAAPFGVLAANTVANTKSTTVTGNLGISPGTTLIGFPPGTVSGTKHVGNATAAQAKADAVAAYNDIAGRTPTATVALIHFAPSTSAAVTESISDSL